MLVFTQKANLPLIYQVATMLLMLWITYTNELLNVVLLNSFGIPTLPYQKVIFMSLSLLLAVDLCLKRRKVILPNLLLFFMVVLGYIFIEYLNVERTSRINIDLIVIWAWIFFLAFILLNMYRSPDQIFVVIDYFLAAVLISNLIILFGIAGIVSFPISYLSSGRPTGEINLNTWSDFSALALIILVVLKLDHNKYWTINKRRTNFLITFFFILPLVTASRGATLICVFAVTILFLNNYFKKDFILKAILTFVIIVIVFMFQEAVKIEPSNFLIGRRFEETSIESGRGIQIITSWNNFLSSPWIGVGYENAAASIFHSITRSNFQYTQILASSGIFFALFYFYFNFKAFGYNFKNLKEPFFFFTISFIFLKYLFRRPDHTFAFLMFLSYHINILFKLRLDNESGNE